MGVDNYVATLKLTPVTDGGRTFAEWWAEFDCAPEREGELAQSIGQGVFQDGVRRAEDHVPPRRKWPPSGRVGPRRIRSAVHGLTGS